MRMNDEVSLWRLFFRIVERGSLSKAAEDLQLEPSSVSRRITALEKRLKVQLLYRSTRNLSLTAAGERAYEKMRPIIEDMEGVLTDLDARSPIVSGTIRITAPVSFGECYVTRWLMAFQRQHPAVLFDLVLSDNRLDLMEEGFDLAIRIGEMSASDLVVRRLGDMPNIICASPAYLAETSVPRRPADLRLHRAVVYSLSREKHLSRLKMERAGETQHVELTGIFFLNNVGAIRQAVIGGAGIHAGPAWLFKSCLETGELVQLLPDWRLAALPVHLVRLKSRYVPHRITALYDWLYQCWNNASLIQ